MSCAMSILRAEAISLTAEWASSTVRERQRSSYAAELMRNGANPLFALARSYAEPIVDTGAAPTHEVQP